MIIKYQTKKMLSMTFLVIFLRRIKAIQLYNKNYLIRQFLYLKLCMGTLQIKKYMYSF